MNKFNRELIIKLAMDDPIVRGYLSAYESHWLIYEQALIAMVSNLVEYNNILSEALMKKKESEVPLVIVHNVPVESEATQKIQKLIQDDKVIFGPGYITKPDGTIEIKHISINPRYTKCQDKDD